MIKFSFSPKKTRLLLLSFILVAGGPGSISFSVFAYDEGNQYLESSPPLFTLTNNNETWENTDTPGTKLVSLERVGGVFWETWAFTHSANEVGLQCGIKDLDYVATLTSMEPVADAIGQIDAYIYYKYSNVEYLNSIKLEVSASNTFENCQTIVAERSEANSAFWNFTVPEPAANQYYRLSIDFKACENNWINLQLLNFYAPQDEDIASTAPIKSFDNNSNERWFNLQGQQVEAPRKGIYIRFKDGEAIKVAL